MTDGSDSAPLRLRMYSGLVCLAGLALSLLVARYQARANDALVQARFDGAARELVDRVVSRVSSYEYGLRGARGSIVSVGEEAISRGSFARYAESRDMEREFPGTRGFGFVRRVPMAHEAAFTAAVRRDDIPDFAVRQLTPHAGERYVIQYIEPLSRNRAAVGLDIASEATRRAAAEQSMRTGSATLTAPITLVQSSEHPARAFLLMLPIYRPHTQHDTPEARERATFGWAYAPLIIDEVLKSFNSESLSLSLDDVTAGAQSQAFFVSVADAAASTLPRGRLSRSVLGRTWDFECQARPHFLANLNLLSPGRVFVVTAFGAVLLAGLLYSYLVSRQLNASLEHQVAERTQLLEDARRHLEKILDALPSMIGYWNKDLVNGFGNYAYTTWFGLAAGALAGKHIRDVLGERIFELNRGYIEAALRGEPQTFERSIARPDGRGLRHSLAHYLPDVLDGQVRGFYALVHDVSDLTESRLQLSAALRENEALLKTLDHLALVSMTDRVGKITYVNEAFCSISGYSRQELLGQDHRIINSGKDPAGLWPDVWRTISHGTPWRGEVCNRAKDGSLYWVDGMIAPNVDERGEIERYISIRTDITAFKRADVQLREASTSLQAVTQQLKTAQRITHVGSWELDIASGRVIWSEELYRVMGLSPSGPAPDYPTQQRLFTDESWARLTPAVQQAVSSGESYELTLDVVRPDGARRSAVARGEALRDASGAVCRLVGTLQDTTDSERAANAMRELTTRLQLATSAAHIGVWDWNLSDNALVWDETMHRLYGIPSDHPMDYEVWRSAVHPSDVDAAVAALQAAVSGVGEYNLSFRIQRRDGATRYLRAVAVVQRDSWGHALRAVGVNWDITEQRVAEIALRSSEVLQRTILTHAGSAIIATDRNGTITLWNPAAESLLSYRADEIVNIATPALIHDPAEVDARRIVLEDEGITIDSGFDIFVAKARAGAVDTNEWTYLRKDGSRVPVLLTVSCLRDATGEIFGYLGVAADLSVRKQQEHELMELNRLLALRGEQAETANKTKSMFLANMSHEIRTPINAVIGFTYLLERSQLNAEQRTLVGKVKLASRSLLGVINDVLDLSKIEAGELTLDESPFDLPELLLDLESMLGSQVRAKGLVLSMRQATDVPTTLVGDVTRLRQILINLLSNAIKFTEKGEIELAVRCEGASATRVQLRCAVRDSGIGIAPEVQARIFAPFTQADASTTRRFGGTGLGLSIVRQLSTLMGGEVGLESVLGVGSEFWVKVPLGVGQSATRLGSADSLGRDVHSHPQSARFAGEHVVLLPDVRVLVVDDSEINREVARRILELDGAVIRTCDNGAEAVELLRREPESFDAVLMDVQMPVMDGLDATRRVRDELGLTNLPIIALTAGVLSSERQRVLDAGMNAFLTKPLDPRAVIESVRHEIERMHGIRLQVRAREAVAVASKQPWPAIEGIDREAVVGLLQTDVEQFITLLRLLLREFDDLIQLSTPNLRDATLRKQYSARVHKLRGSAGILGATTIYRLAGSAEDALNSQGATTEDAALQVRELVKALTTLRAHAQPVFMALEAQAAQLPKQVAVAPEPKAIRLLLTLLHERDLAAHQRFRELADALASVLDPQRFLQLREAVESYRFADAARLLEECGAAA